MSRAVTDKAEHLTRDQKAQLESELATLEGPKRAEIVEAIATARGFGDLSENFEYHAAKNEQGLLERRITILRDRLQRAVLVDEEAAAASAEIRVGSRVSIELDDGETMASRSRVWAASLPTRRSARLCSARRSATRSWWRRLRASGARKSLRSVAEPLAAD